MSFAALKKSSNTSLKALTEKLTQESAGQKSYGDDRFWQPEVDKSNNGFAVIRFLPAPEGHDLPYVKLYSHGFKQGTRWFIENCPTTIGENCPCCEANNALWETGDKANQDIVRKRKRGLHYIANILVVSDPKHPENEGKVFLYKFGKKIFEKISQAINPEFEDEQALDPFNFWSGANFKLKIRNVEGYRNYDKSEFEASSELFDGDDKALEALWKKQHDLKSLIAADAFKPYAQIKANLDKVLGTPVMQEVARGAAAREEEDAEEASTPRAEPEARVAKKAAKPAEDDDDLAAYRGLLDD